MLAEWARNPSPINAPSSGRRADTRTRLRLDPLPLIALAAGLGLLACSWANTLAREAREPSLLLFWAGLLLIVVPLFYRLTSRQASRRERLALVCLLALSLYAVKLIRDAPLFTFTDEPVHAFNAAQIALHHHLFHGNPILPVTPSYPGLGNATSALMSLTGMSSYGAGIALIAAARLLLAIAMFLLFERVSGSARTAGLGVAIFSCNFNFLFWSAQYSYESLALPLFVFIAMAVAERNASPPRSGKAWAVPIVLAIFAIVVTHHLTSYATAVFLGVLAIGYRLIRKDWSWPNPRRLAIFAAILAIGWLLLVANSTFGYLSPVLGKAIEAIFHTASGEAPPRTLFQGRGPAPAETPTLARGIALLAVLLLLVALPFGLRRVWQRYRRQPLALIFALGALGVFATLALRLAPAAWETGNRASEFFFIGLAFVIACAGLQNWRPRGRERLGRAALSGAFAIVLVGGIVAGWPWNLLLSEPLRVQANGGTISSEPLAMAEWARHNLPESARFAADPADARLLLTPGERRALAGLNPDYQDIIDEPALSNWEVPLLRRHHLRYVVADRREISTDTTKGYYFRVRGQENRLRPLSAITKFGRIPGAARIFSDGNIAVYDLGPGR